MGTVVLLGAAPMAPGVPLAAALPPAPELRSVQTVPAREMGVVERGESLVFVITPERRALLNTIRYAEGTWVGGSDEGYRVIYVSAAAGAYQFLPSTWREAPSQLGLADFGPRNQDQAALYLMRKRGALSPFDARGLTTEVLARLAPEWASLPAHHGGSYYGQPVKGVEELQRFFQGELRRLRPS